MLESSRAVLYGHTSISAFAFTPSQHSLGRTSTITFDFFMQQSSPLSSLKLKHRQQLKLACQAQTSQYVISLSNDEVPVHGLSEMIVAVFGGGQLSRMLCQAASKMAIKVMVLDPQDNCPASSLAYHHMVGNYDDSATVEEFAKKCGVLTVEIEHLDVATMEKLEQQGIDCQPKASTIRIIQDKYLQKVHFSQHDIPLPEYMRVPRDVEKFLAILLWLKVGDWLMVGRGNAVARSEEELSFAVDGIRGKLKFA